MLRWKGISGCGHGLLSGYFQFQTQDKLQSKELIKVKVYRYVLLLCNELSMSTENLYQNIEHTKWNNSKPHMHVWQRDYHNLCLLL